MNVHRLLREGVLALTLLLAAGTAGAVAGGTPVADEAFRQHYPWLVLIEPKEGGVVRCSGVLVSPGWVLTAAHCASTEHVVLVGSAARSGARRIGIRRHLVHPGYSAKGLINDLGLLELETPVPGVPVRIATVAEAQALLRPGNPAQLVGWGQVGGESRPDRLHGTGLVIRNLQGVPGQFAFLSEKGGACDGDSGSPLLMTLPGRELVVIGLASGTAGNLCQQGGGVTAYANVVELKAFIRDNVPDWKDTRPSARL